MLTFRNTLARALTTFSKKRSADRTKATPVTPPKSPPPAIFALLKHLCNDDDQLTLWVARWIAYPMRNPGAKMRTALVIHDGQGSGKSLFFQYIVKPFYGVRGRWLDNFSINSAFNDWADSARFVISENLTIKNNPALIKSLLTSHSIEINSKGYWPINQPNEMNFIFLYNDQQPCFIPVDDRRYMTIEVHEAQPLKFYDAVAEEMENDGATAFCQWLLHGLDMGGFNTSTPPYDSELSNKKIAA